MSIQYVNTGSGANAGNGDSLRTAFYKINNNFAELSAFSNTDTSVIIINAFPPTTSTEGTIWYDTVSGRNFIYYDGFWVDAAPPAVEPINLTTVTSHILPGADLTYDLGSTSSQWRSLYVGTNTIYIGGIPVSISNNSLVVNGQTTPTFDNNGNLTFPGGMTIETQEGGGARLIIDGKGNYIDIRDSGTILIGYNSTGTVQIGNPGGGTLTEIISEKVKFLLQAIPASSIGSFGDTPGLVAFNGTYIYYCTGTYNGVDNIWKRVSWSGDTW